MKIFLIITVLVVFIFIGFLLFYRQDDTTVLVGTIKDLESSIEKMMISTKEDAFVIATIYGTDDFIQFSGNAKNVQLDFPQITDRQRSSKQLRTEEQVENYSWTSTSKELLPRFRLLRGPSLRDFLI
jgi:hypothetical protein